MTPRRTEVRPGPGRRRRILAVSALAAALPLGAAARVFLRTPGDLHGPTTAGRPGWTLAYRARFRINGGAARIEALGAALPPQAALRALEAAYRDRGGAAFSLAGEHMGWGFAQVGDRVVRFLAVPTDRPGECMVFRIEQRTEEFLASMTPPGRPNLTALPPPEHGRVAFFAANENSGTEYEIVETVLPAAAQGRAMARAAEAAGWRDLLPRDGPGGVRVLARGRDVGIWLVRETAGGRTQTIRILRRGDAR